MGVRLSLCDLSCNVELLAGRIHWSRQGFWVWCRLQLQSVPLIDVSIIWMDQHYCFGQQKAPRALFCMDCWGYEEAVWPQLACLRYLSRFWWLICCTILAPKHASLEVSFYFTESTSIIDKVPKHCCLSSLTEVLVYLVCHVLHTDDPVFLSGLVRQLTMYQNVRWA